jgi:hypothetical protein
LVGTTGSDLTGWGSSSTNAACGARGQRPRRASPVARTLRRALVWCALVRPWHDDDAHQRVAQCTVIPLALGSNEIALTSVPARR